MPADAMSENIKGFPDESKKKGEQSYEDIN